MADGKELKPKSFRIDDETAEKIKGIANRIGGNQQEAFIKLIEAYEFQSGKETFSNKKEEIEKFEKHINIITRIFMNSLEDNQCITETVQAEFDALLKSKDVAIQDLQKKITEVNKVKEKIIEKLNADIEEKAHLQNIIDRQEKEYTAKLEGLQAKLEGKEELNKTLINSCNDFKTKIESLEEKIKTMEKTKEYLNTLEKEHTTIKAEFVQIQKEKEKFENLLKQEQGKHKEEMNTIIKQREEALHYIKEQAKITMEKALLEKEQEYQQNIARLNTEKQAEIAEYLQKYSDLIEKNREYIKKTSE